MYKRLDKETLTKLSFEYQEHYVLYNSISSAVEDYESSQGGLRAVELWADVLRLEHELPKAPRMDRYIAEVRTQLMSRYDRFYKVVADGKIIYEPERKKEEIERSVVCVLFALGMRLGCYFDDQENPYEPIMERIRKMALQSKDLEMVKTIAKAYYDEEDVEESFGNVAPEEDVLRPHMRVKLPLRLKEIHLRVKPAMQYMSMVLLNESGLKPEFDFKGYISIWADLARNETIMEEMGHFSNVVNTMDKRDPDIPEEVVKNAYNLKLLLNIIGVMIEKGVVNKNATQVAGLFFTDSKDMYFFPRTYMKFGDSHSGFRTKEVYELVCTIIDSHKK